MAEKNLAAVLLSPKADFVIQERPIPTPGPGELVIRTHAVGLNPIDWKRQAWDFLVSSYPAVLGTGMLPCSFSVTVSVTPESIVCLDFLYGMN